MVRSDIKKRRTKRKVNPNTTLSKFADDLHYHTTTKDIATNYLKEMGKRGNVYKKDALLALYFAGLRNGEYSNLEEMAKKFKMSKPDTRLFVKKLMGIDKEAVSEYIERAPVSKFSQDWRAESMVLDVIEERTTPHFIKKEKVYYKGDFEPHYDKSRTGDFYGSKRFVQQLKETKLGRRNKREISKEIRELEKRLDELVITKDKKVDDLKSRINELKEMKKK